MTEQAKDKPIQPELELELSPDNASTNFYWTYGVDERFNIQTTIRGIVSDAQIAAHVESAKRAMKYIVGQGGHAKPVGRQSNGGNGNGQPPQPQQQTPAPEVGTPEDYCNIHNTKMYHNKNERGEWWSHKTDDPAYPKGFCNGKPRK